MPFTKTGVPISCDPSLVDDDGFETLDDGSTQADRRIWPWEQKQNWQTGENYSDPSRASKHRWAWEFLNRNKEFHKDYEENLRPLQLEGERHLGNNKATRDYEFRFSRAEHAFFDRWGIERFSHSALFRDMNDPHAPDTPIQFRAGAVNSPRRTYLKPEFSGSGEEEPVYLFKAIDGEIPIVFNMTWPLEPQMARAKRWLSLNRENFTSHLEVKPAKTVRMHVKKYPIYLRVWDARAEGVSYEKIARKLSGLFSDSADVRKAIENAESAAARLIDDKQYKLIPIGATSTRAKPIPK